MLRKLRSNAMQFREPAAQQSTICDDAKIDHRSMFPLCSKPVQQFLEEIFTTACGVAPAFVNSAKVVNTAVLRGVFADLADVCQESLRLDPSQRHKLICSHMAKWTNVAQTHLAGAVAQKFTQDLNTKRDELTKSDSEQSAEFVIFILQMKLQASARLIDDDYVRKIIDDSHHSDISNIRQQDTQCMAIDESSAINALIFRKESSKVSRGKDDRKDFESSVALNRAAWRRRTDPAVGPKPIADSERLPGRPANQEDDDYDDDGDAKEVNAEEEGHGTYFQSCALTPRFAAPQCRSKVYSERRVKELANC
jgi:hypothetical protein